MDKSMAPTWATRQVSFKEQSRIVGQSLSSNFSQWDKQNQTRAQCCRPYYDYDGNLDKSVVRVALASAQCSLVSPINPFRVDSRNTCWKKSWSIMRLYWNIIDESFRSMNTFCWRFRQKKIQLISWFSLWLALVKKLTCWVLRRGPEKRLDIFERSKI